MTVSTISGSHNVTVNRPDVSLKIRALLEGLLTVTAHVLRHFTALFAQVAVQRALVRVRPAALETGIRLLAAIASDDSVQVT